jgi:hypothetical protein
MSDRKLQSVINRSAVKKFALKVSRERRANKFDRVGTDFFENIEAQVEAVIRSIAIHIPDGQLEPDDDREFITGAAMEKLRQRLNQRAKSIVQGSVIRHPSIGKTLKG